MPIRKEFLEIIRCPVTHQPLQVLSDEQLAQLNQRIAEGKVQSTNGAKVESALQEGLITTDAKTIYRVDDGIPVMLAEEGISADQLADA